MGFDINKKGHKAVFGIFSERSSLDKAIDSLRAHGFRSSDISVLMQSKDETSNIVREKHTKAPEGLATGATGGILAGGALGWLAGAGLLAIPGIGPFVAAGPIMAAIAGAGIGGTIGGVAGGLIGLGIPEHEAKRYENFVKEGGMLISVHVDDSSWASKAKDVLTFGGARDISVTGEENSYFRYEDDESVASGNYQSKTSESFLNTFPDSKM